MKKALLVLIPLAAFAADLNIGRWQNSGGGNLSIGRWQPSGGAAACSKPTVADTTVTANVGTPMTVNMVLTGAPDSVATLDALSDGLSITKTGANIGRITGTPTTEAAKDTMRIVAYKCNTDSTDTGLFIITVNAAAVDSFTLDTNAVNGSIALSPAPTNGKYAADDSVFLTATADTYYHFTEWSDSLSGSKNPDTLVMDTNKVVTASFAKDSIFADSVAPDSGVVGTIVTWYVRGMGAVQGSSTIKIIDSEGDTVNLNGAQIWNDSQVIDTIPVGLDTGWVDFIFVGHWNSDTLDSAYKVISGGSPPDSYTVSTSTTGSGSGTVTKDPDIAKYQSGDSVTVAALPGAHASFQGWSGDTSTVADTLRFDVLKNWTLTAEFWADSFGLAYSITGGNAAVTFLGDSIAAYNENITCTLTVLPGYAADWPGGHVGAGKSVLTVLMTKDSTLAITTHAWPEYTIDTVYDVHAPITTPHASLAFDSAFPPPPCTLYVEAAPGYIATWPGGTNVIKDTLIVSVTKDSTVTATSTVIPVIDSIKIKPPTPRRDYFRVCAARRADTVRIIPSTDIGDSGTLSAVWLARDTTEQMTITRWKNGAGANDTIEAIVPANGPVNVNYRPRIRVAAGVYSSLGTPVTWREGYILLVKGRL